MRRVSPNPAAEYQVAAERLANGSFSGRRGNRSYLILDKVMGVG